MVLFGIDGLGCNVEGWENSAQSEHSETPISPVKASLHGIIPGSFIVGMI